MIDLERQIHDYYEAIIDPVDVDRITTEPSRVKPVPMMQRRGWVVAVGTALVVVLVVGGALLLLGGSESPIGDDPSLSTVPPTTSTATTATDQSLSVGWQQVAVGEAWVESLIDLAPLPEGGFIAASTNPWSLWWSPDGSAWYDADPESQVTEYVRLASRGSNYLFSEPDGEPDHHFELFATPPLIATLGDSTVVLDPTNVGMWVGYPRSGEWESIRFDSTGLDGPPRLLTIAASDTEAMVIGRSPAGDYLSLTATADGVTSGWTPIAFTRNEQEDLESSLVGWLHQRWVLVLQHSDETGFFVSPDGGTWTEVDPPEYCCGFFVDMTIGPAGVVVSSHFPYEEDPSAVSSDGLSWVGFRWDSQASAYSETLGYVSVDAAGGRRLEVSEDGRTWRSRSDAPSSLAYPARLTASGRTLLAYDAVLDGAPIEPVATPALWAWFSG